MPKVAANWEDIGYIKRSKNRVKALVFFLVPKMPSELAKEMKISITHASKICRELNSKRLIECLNNKLKMGRIYQTTIKGESVLRIIKS